MAIARFDSPCRRCPVFVFLSLVFEVVMSTWYPIARLISSLVLMTLGGSAMYASVLVLEPAAAEFGTGRGAASLPYALFMLGFGIGGVLMGRMADKVGVLVPALAGSFMLPAGLLAAAHADTIVGFCVALGVMCGLLGASFSFAPLVADVSLWFYKRRGLAVGIAISGNYVAGAIWPPILQSSFDVQGWRQTFIDLAVFDFLCMVPIAFMLWRRPPAHDESGDSADSTHRAERPLGFGPNQLQCVICLAGVSCCVAMAMPQVHIVPYAIDLGFAAQQGAQMLALMLGFGVVSRVASGWLSDRIGGLRTLLLGGSLQCLVLGCFMFADTLPLLYAASIAFGLSQGGIVPSYAIIVRTFFPPGEAGWRIGAALMSTMVGMAFGAWMSGTLYDLTGSYDVAFITAIGFNVVNIVIALNLLRRAKRVSGEGSLVPA
jgi:MFS family permease